MPKLNLPTILILATILVAVTSIVIAVSISNTPAQVAGINPLPPVPNQKLTLVVCGRNYYNIHITTNSYRLQPWVVNIKYDNKLTGDPNLIFEWVKSVYPKNNDDRYYPGRVQIIFRNIEQRDQFLVTTH